MTTQRRPNSITLLTVSEVDARIRELAAEIDQRFQDSDPPVLVVTIKNGGVWFAARLLRYTLGRYDTDSVRASSYGYGRRAGTVELLESTRNPVENRVVLLVDDVIDSGETLRTVRKLLLKHGALNVYSAVLVSKRRPRVVVGAVAPDFVGFELGNEWIYGCGMDLDNDDYRTLPELRAVVE